MGVMWAACHCLQGHACSVTSESTHLDSGVWAGRTERCSVFREVRSRHEDLKQKTRAFSLFRGRILPHPASPARNVSSEMSPPVTGAAVHALDRLCVWNLITRGQLSTHLGRASGNACPQAATACPSGPDLVPSLDQSIVGCRGWGDRLGAAGAGPPSSTELPSACGVRSREKAPGVIQPEGRKLKVNAEAAQQKRKVCMCLCMHACVCTCVYACMCVSKESSECMRPRGDKDTRCFPQRSFDSTLF